LLEVGEILQGDSRLARTGPVFRHRRTAGGHQLELPGSGDVNRQGPRLASVLRERASHHALLAQSEDSSN
jgi:hypothetical protein